MFWNTKVVSRVGNIRELKDKNVCRIKEKKTLNTKSINARANDNNSIFLLVGHTKIKAKYVDITIECLELAYALYKQRRKN